MSDLSTPVIIRGHVEGEMKDGVDNFSSDMQKNLKGYINDMYMNGDHLEFFLEDASLLSNGNFVNNGVYGFGISFTKVSNPIYSFNPIGLDTPIEDIFIKFVPFYKPEEDVKEEYKKDIKTFEKNLPSIGKTYNQTKLFLSEHLDFIYECIFQTYVFKMTNQKNNSFVLPIYESIICDNKHNVSNVRNLIEKIQRIGNDNVNIYNFLTIFLNKIEQDNKSFIGLGIIIMPFVQVDTVAQHLQKSTNLTITSSSYELEQENKQMYYLIVAQLVYYMIKMYQLTNIFHDDIHFSNALVHTGKKKDYPFNEKIFIIDFGRARYKQKKPMTNEEFNKNITDKEFFKQCINKLIPKIPNGGFARTFYNNLFYKNKIISLDGRKKFNIKKLNLIFETIQYIHKETISFENKEFEKMTYEEKEKEKLKSNMNSLTTLYRGGKKQRGKKTRGKKKKRIYRKTHKKFF